MDIESNGHGLRDSSEEGKEEEWMLCRDTFKMRLE